MEGSIFFYSMFLQLLCYGYLSQREMFFYLVGTCVRTIIITDFVPLTLFNGLVSSYLSASMKIIRNISWALGFPKLNTGLMRKVKFLLKNPANDQ